MSASTGAWGEGGGASKGKKDHCSFHRRGTASVGFGARKGRVYGNFGDRRRKPKQKKEEQM